MRGRLRGRLLVAIGGFVAVAVFVPVSFFAQPSIGALVVALVAGAIVATITSSLAVNWFDEAVRPLTEAAQRMHEGDLGRARGDRPRRRRRTAR